MIVFKVKSIALLCNIFIYLYTVLNLGGKHGQEICIIFFYYYYLINGLLSSPRYRESILCNS